MTKEKQIMKLAQIMYSLALDCSEHLQKQHNQEPNDKPRFYFDNIAKQCEELLKELGGMMGLTSLKDELCEGIDPTRPVPYDEILEAREGRIGADRTDWVFVVGKIEEKRIIDGKIVYVEVIK